MAMAMANEQEKLLPLAFHASISAHRFQNDGVKKGWGGLGRRIRFRFCLILYLYLSLLFLVEYQWHKRCVEWERFCVLWVTNE